MAGLAGPAAGVYRQLAEWSGTSPLRCPLQLGGCNERTAKCRAPGGGSMPDTGISRLPQLELSLEATEYRDHKRPAEGGYRAFFYDGHCHRDWHSVALCRKTSASSLSTGT